MPVYRQKIIYRKIVDGIDTTEIILPKIINTDIGFDFLLQRIIASLPYY